MKKCLFILTLCTLQGACAHYDSEQAGRAPLLTYQELGAEISVTRIEVEDTTDESSALADVVAATR